MGNLAASAVSVVSSYTMGGTSGKRAVCRRLRLALSGQGTATNQITASVLGFKAMDGCTNLYDSNNVAVYPATLNEDGSLLLLSDPAQATDADRPDAADLTIDPAYITVWGQPA